MGFLKLLADGLHHAYWKDQASFEAQVAPFLPPGAAMDASLVAGIFSIGFFDSMCVIEKRAGVAEAGLGERVLAGREATVDPRPLTMAGNIVKPSHG
jgi:hypothetical protein